MAPEFSLDLTGGLNAAQGKATWPGEKGRISAGINQADLEFLWAGGRDSGKCLRVPGRLRISERQFPPAPSGPIPLSGLIRRAPIQVSLQGKAQEKGLLSAFFPGMIEETRGNIDLDFEAGGNLGEAEPSGNAPLTNAGASLPFPRDSGGGSFLPVETPRRADSDRIAAGPFRSRTGRRDGDDLAESGKWSVLKES